MHKITPETFSLQQAYKKQQEEHLAAQKETHALRVLENRKKAEIKTSKIVREYTAPTTSQSSSTLTVPAEPEFFLAIRIRGMNRVPPKQRKALDILRLRAPNTAVFLRNNESVRSMLQSVRNYIAYGFIPADLMREFVYKRGFAKIRCVVPGRSAIFGNAYREYGGEGEIVNITSEIIEDRFGGDFVCVEDLCREIWTGGKRFAEVNRFLMPFTLNSPRGGFKGKKSRDYLNGGSCGNFFGRIEDLVRRMID